MKLTEPLQAKVSSDASSRSFHLRRGITRWAGPIALVLFGLGHFSVLVLNALRVPLTQGYDWPGHLTYLFHVADTGHPPTPSVSAGFFNMPLYYYSVVLFHRLSQIPLLPAGYAFNVGLGMATFGLWAALSWKLWKGELVGVVWSVGLYVCQPTVYRAFGMVRPEPLLLPLFVAAGWLVVWASEKQPHWALLGALSGLLAGLSFCVRQWGAFLGAALAFWLLLRRGRLPRLTVDELGPVVLHSVLFAALAIAVLGVRGGGPLAFNTRPHMPDLGFWTRLALPELFSTPVRPALNDRFWPVLYADTWGDYWRYWWEARMDDALPSSVETVALLSRSMWAALPMTVMVIVGWCLPAIWQEEQDEFHRWTRVLSLVALGGFATFSGIYADPGKGDTVKGVYLVYLAPYVAWLGASAARTWHQSSTWGRWSSWGPFALVVIFVAPLSVYVPPDRMASHSWEKPSTDVVTMAGYGKTVTLIGYRDVVWNSEQEVLSITLVWRADEYTGRSYKVFVHLVSPEGELLAQSDTVPAQWTRPTEAWMLGEYVVDPHSLASVGVAIPAGAVLRVGLYERQSGSRLETKDGLDYVIVDLDRSLIVSGDESYDRGAE